VTATPAFWANWVFYAYAVVWLPFACATVLYAARSPWRERPVGWALMTLLGSLTAILTFVLVAMAVPLPRDVIDVLRGLTLGGVSVAGWLLLRQIYVLQGRNDLESAHPHSRSTDI
jgi:hypothetical protein